MMSSGINLVMTVIGFTVSTMFIVFVCTRLICARIQLTTSRRSFLVLSSTTSDLTIMERGVHGVEPLVMANLQTKKYSDVFFSSSEDAQCTVCLGEYSKEDILRVLPYCGHSFHATCIDKWLQQQATCPVCRISLHELPEKKRMQPMFSSAVRSHYGVESLGTNSYPCLSTITGLSSRVHDDHRMEPIQENQFESETHGVEARESITILIEDGRTAKDSGNKHVESPSNT